MNYEYVTLVVNIGVLNRMLTFYHDQLIPTNEDYVEFMVKSDGIVIKAYSSKHKETFKVIFSGLNAITEAKIWDINATINAKKTIEKKTWKHLTHIGSDEVGVGDLFGPIVVVAAYVEISMIDELKMLGVNDSKKLTEIQIRNLAPILMKRVTYHSLTMDNKKLNEMIAKKAKTLSLEALMHNKCHQCVLKKLNEDNIPVFVDQFLKEDTYIRYLNGASRPRLLNFATKGESELPAIAVASVIARYIFLIYMDKLNEKYKTNFPFGASKNVDIFLNEFINRHGLELTSSLVKTHFNNFASLIECDNEFDLE